MKYIVIILLMILHFEISSQNKLINDFKSVNISKTNDELIYVFDSTSTKKIISLKKKNKYLNYYQMSECDYLRIDTLLKKDLVSIKKIKPEEIKHFVRQYFPYINKSGEIIILIILLKREDNNSNFNYNNWPLACFDCKNSFFNLIFNLSKNKLNSTD